MRRRTRRAGAAAVAGAVVLGVLSAGPLGWGLGCVLAVSCAAWGATALYGVPRPYDYAKDGI